MNNNDKNMFESTEKLILKSNAMILFYMGISFAEGGMTGENDYQKAVDCYRQAAKLGNTDAMYCLAISYAKGLGVKLDHSIACDWYAKAASGGHSQSMYNLGLCFENGLGVDIDIDASFEYFKRAAELGNNDAIMRMEGRKVDIA